MKVKCVATSGTTIPVGRMVKGEIFRYPETENPLIRRSFVDSTGSHVHATVLKTGEDVIIPAELNVVRLKGLLHYCDNKVECDYLDED